MPLQSKMAQADPGVSKLSAPHRVLTMAHGHPKFSQGGAEIAAYDLFQAYAAHLDVEDAWFLARADLKRGARGRITSIGPAEYVWEQSLSDLFMMQAQNRHEVAGYFSEFLELTKPTIVHTHHYFQFGLEYLRAIKRVDSSIVTLLTLHEFMAICPNQGLMKSLSGKICASGHYLDHLDCHRVATPTSLWLRKHRFERYFDFVDQFICPSDFLRDRYLEWGLPAERMVVIENGQTGEPLPIRATAKPSKTPNRFGFFGQINEHKGLDIVLKGIAALPNDQRQRIRLDVNGANLEQQPRSFQRRIQALADPLIASGILNWRGPYKRGELSQRMLDVDWVIVPSTWFENSPLVIQEAFSNGKPVIASNIGALPEKIGFGSAGHLIQPEDHHAWANRLVALSDDFEGWQKICKSLPAPPIINASATACLAAANMTADGKLTT